jgi:hypothetical protein
MKNAIGRTARKIASTGPGVVVLVVAIGVGVAYSATNGGPGHDNGKRGDRPPPPPQLSDSQKQGLQAFQQCMQDQGLQRPQRGTAPTAADLAKLRAAEDACIDQFPSDLPYQFMGPPGPGGPGGPGHHPPGPPPGAPQGAPQDDSQSNG